MYPDPHSRSADLYARAQAFLPGGNTRHTVHFEPYPVYAVRGRAAWVTDVDGNDYLDYVNNYSSLIHGHSHPRVVAAAPLPRLASPAAPAAGWCVACLPSAVAATAATTAAASFPAAASSSAAAAAAAAAAGVSASSSEAW